MTAQLTAEETDRLFREYRDSKERRVRNRLVEAHVGFGHHIAKRYHNRGVATDDLHQVALLALVKAVDRFDPDNGAAFTTFAGRTIEGEIKRYFRDRSWAVRVPRSAKEMHLLVRRANDELSQTLHRSPTAREVATHLDVEIEEVVRALAASAAFSSESLDAPGRGDGSENDMGQERVGAIASTDPRLEETAERVMIERLMAELPERQAEIVRLRFFEALTQTEISEQVGVSQMHVSRLLRRALATMREQADAADDAYGSAL